MRHLNLKSWWIFQLAISEFPLVRNQTLSKRNIRLQNTPWTTLFSRCPVIAVKWPHQDIRRNIVCNILLRLLVSSSYTFTVGLRYILHRRCMHEYILPLLTVALITRIYLSFQSFSFCKLGQHFCQQTWILRRHLLAIAVIPLGKLQGQVPERFYSVWFIVTGKTRNL